MHELKWVSGNAETGRVARPPVLGVSPRRWATAMTMAAGLFAGAIIATVFGPFGSSRRAPDVVRLLTGRAACEFPRDAWPDRDGLFA